MRKGSIAAIKNTALRRTVICVTAPVLMLIYCTSWIWLIPFAIVCGAVDGARDEMSRLWWSPDFRLLRAGFIWMWAEDYHTDTNAALKRATNAVRPYPTWTTTR